MANEFKVKNGIKFADNTTQTTAAQPILVSGTNIKTVNGNSLLGSGNITITGASELSIGSTAPASPSTTPFWWDSNGGSLYIYYNDGDSSQWVPATPAVDASNLIRTTDLKTINNTSLVGSGNISLVSGTISISVVTALPGSPDPNTLYIVTG